MRPALLAVAHGSVDARAVASVEAIVDGVRHLLRGDGHRPQLALLDHADRHGVPDVPGALAGLAAARRPVVAVPLLLSEAYHARVDLPGQLATARRDHPSLRVVQSSVLGPDPLLDAAVRRRAAECVGRLGDPSTALVLAAAGSTSRQTVAEVRTRARLHAGDGWWAVRAAFASAAGPTVGPAVTALLAEGAPRVVVASYLLAPGRLSDRVRHQAYAAGATAVTEPLAGTAEVARLVVCRYEDRAGALDRPRPVMAGAATPARGRRPAAPRARSTPRPRPAHPSPRQ